MDIKIFFTKALLTWNIAENKREMPWKGEKDPYKIWISEIILQQTRVEQGLEYYNRFIKAFPTAKHIATASETDVFKLWQGLGYYSRCKNIIFSAKFISGERKNKFPDTYDEIIKLKGVGSYTASAIASFAFNLPHAVVDGNVFRVLSRFFGINTPVDTSEGKKLFTQLANELLDKKNAATYNQTIMDFGAVICKPQPLCPICPLKKHCIAFNKNLIKSLPVKEKRIIKKVRWLYYLVIQTNNKFYVRKRVNKDIWQNLFEFVLIEIPNQIRVSDLKNLLEFKSIFKSPEFTIENISEIFKQQLTHQTIFAQFILIKSKSHPSLKNYESVTKNKLKKLPFSKLTAEYLQMKNYV